jgi:hypothetical protein
VELKSWRPHRGLHQIVAEIEDLVAASDSSVSSRDDAPPWRFVREASNDLSQIGATQMKAATTRPRG